MIKKDKLDVSFRDSIKNDVADIIKDAMEIGLDSVIEDNIFREIPFVSTVVKLYGIGSTIKEKNYIKNLICFLNKINSCIWDDEREKYTHEFSQGTIDRNKELEYILVIIEKFIEEEQAENLAQLYLSYLKGEILWSEFVSYSIIIDRLLPGDLFKLRQGDIGKIALYPPSDISAPPIRVKYDHSIHLRLIGNGLMEEIEGQYNLTEFGNKLVNIFGWVSSGRDWNY